MLPECLLIDLDDTVYSPSSGVWDAISLRIEAYMRDRLGIRDQDIPALRADLHKRYGTTLRGLALTRSIDATDYLAYVHDIPLADFLEPDLCLREALNSLPQSKWIFTNADRAHAERTLALIGLEDCFLDIIDIRSIWPFCKPMPEAFEKAVELCGFPASECLFIDDTPANLFAAQEFGLRGLLISAQKQIPGLSSISSLVDLPAWLSDLETQLTHSQDRNNL